MGPPKQRKSTRRSAQIPEIAYLVTANQFTAPQITACRSLTLAISVTSADLRCHRLICVH